jgi:hypothetical protein
MKKLFDNIRASFFVAVILILTAAPGICLAIQDTAEEKLERAREDLRLSLTTRKRIADKLEPLKRTGKTSPEIIKEYETYLKNVELMVSENRRIVKNMEAAVARRTGSHPSAAATAPDPLRGSGIPEEITVDRLTALDRELDGSLAAFDELLLNELELIRARSADKMRDFALDAADAADAANRLEEKGETSGSAGTPGSPGSPGASEKDGTGRYDGAGQKKDSSTGTTDYGRKERRPGTKGGAAQKESRKRDDKFQDDDIVARQLREAAEKETDPALKERLWKKYDEYKNSTRE